MLLSIEIVRRRAPTSAYDGKVSFTKPEPRWGGGGGGGRLGDASQFQLKTAAAQKGCAIAVPTSTEPLRTTRCSTTARPERHQCSIKVTTTTPTRGPPSPLITHRKCHRLTWPNMSRKQGSAHQANLLQFFHGSSPGPQSREQKEKRAIQKCRGGQEKPKQGRKEKKALGRRLKVKRQKHLS